MGGKKKYIEMFSFSQSPSIELELGHVPDMKE